MKNLFILSGLFLSFGLAKANAADHCSMGDAKKYIDAIIGVQLTEDDHKKGRLVFERSKSQDYTKEYLAEQIDLVGERHAGKYIEMKKELDANPRLHFYRLQYAWIAKDGNNSGFYYMVHMKNYDRGCGLEKIISD